MTEFHDAKIHISAVIKARNEARQIGDCIRSVAGFASEVIVVDDDSDDATASIAQDLGATVIRHKSKDGHIDELDYVGFEAAHGIWILRLDADERLPPDLAARLLDVAGRDDVAAVRFARKNMMFGGWARHGGWFVVDQVRFFRTDAWDRAWDYRRLHTQVPVRGEVLDLPADERLAVLHLNYDSVPQFVERSLWHYAWGDALAIYRNGGRFSPVRLLLRPARRFLGRFIIRQGWRDGARGMILAGMLSAYEFCVEANLWDIERRVAAGDKELTGP